MVRSLCSLYVIRSQLNAGVDMTGLLSRVGGCSCVTLGGGPTWAGGSIDDVSCFHVEVLLSRPTWRPVGGGGPRLSLAMLPFSLKWVARGAPVHSGVRLAPALQSDNRAGRSSRNSQSPDLGMESLQVVRPLRRSVRRPHHSRVGYAAVA